MTETDAIIALIALFEREGYARIEPPVLQPADVFIDLSGEDIRRRMFVTAGCRGPELCLRPEYTIPVCRQHPGSPAAAGPRGAHLWRPGLPPASPARAGEFLQAGIESIGRRDGAAADAEVLGLALEAWPSSAAPGPTVTLGDMGLFNALIDALGIAPAAKRARHPRPSSRARGSRGLTAGLTVRAARTCGPARAPSRARHPQAARAFVEDMLVHRRHRAASAAAAPARSPSASSPAPRNRAGLADEARGCSRATSPSRAIRDAA